MINKIEGFSGTPATIKLNNYGEVRRLIILGVNNNEPIWGKYKAYWTPSEHATFKVYSKETKATGVPDTLTDNRVISNGQPVYLGENLALRYGKADTGYGYRDLLHPTEFTKIKADDSYTVTDSSDGRADIAFLMPEQIPYTLNVTRGPGVSGLEVTLDNKTYKPLANFTGTAYYNQTIRVGATILPGEYEMVISPSYSRIPDCDSTKICNMEVSCKYLGFAGVNFSKGPKAIRTLADVSQNEFYNQDTKNVSVKLYAPTASGMTVKYYLDSMKYIFTDQGTDFVFDPLQKYTLKATNTTGTMLTNNYYITYWDYCWDSDILVRAWYLVSPHEAKPQAKVIGTAANNYGAQCGFGHKFDKIEPYGDIAGSYSYSIKLPVGASFKYRYTTKMLVKIYTETSTGQYASLYSDNYETTSGWNTYNGSAAIDPPANILRSNYIFKVKDHTAETTLEQFIDNITTTGILEISIEGMETISFTHSFDWSRK